MAARPLGACLGLTGPRVASTLTTALRHPLSSRSLGRRCPGRGGRPRAARSPQVTFGPAQKALLPVQHRRPPVSPTPPPTSSLALPPQDLPSRPRTGEMGRPPCRVETTQRVPLILKARPGRVSERGVPGQARRAGPVPEPVTSTAHPLRS